MKPAITLKNIKHFGPGSHETNCYTAIIYVDGKKFAHVENNGHGGCDNVHPFDGGWKEVKELEELIKATYPRVESAYFPDGMEPSLEIICGELLEEFLDKKEFKKVMRRIVYVKPNEKGLFQLPAKHKPTPDTMRALKAKTVWANGVVFLCDLPTDEAYALFKSNTQHT